MLTKKDKITFNFFVVFLSILLISFTHKKNNSKRYWNQTLLYTIHFREKIINFSFLLFPQ